jgi:hypothetical protein
MFIGVRAQAQSQTKAQHCPMDTNRADKGMGFSQEKTTHHFTLTPQGGEIAVTAKDATDNESRDQIRMHLTHIAHAFAAGDFDIPMLVHDQTPPGVPVMKEKKDKIQYRYEESQNGGKVVIATEDSQALSGIHEFLAFQIREHKTGDSVDVR